MSSKPTKKQKIAEAQSLVALALGESLKQIPKTALKALAETMSAALLERDRLAAALVRSNEQPRPKFAPGEELLALLHRCQNGLATCRFAANEIENYIETEIALARKEKAKNPPISTIETVLADFYERAVQRTRDFCRQVISDRHERTDAARMIKAISAPTDPKAIDSAVAKASSRKPAKNISEMIRAIDQMAHEAELARCNRLICGHCSSDNEAHATVAYVGSIGRMPGPGLQTRGHHAAHDEADEVGFVDLATASTAATLYRRCVQNFANRDRWFDSRPGLQWMGKRNPIEYSEDVLKNGRAMALDGLKERHQAVMGDDQIKAAIAWDSIHREQIMTLCALRRLPHPPIGHLCWTPEFWTSAHWRWFLGA